MRKKRSHLNDVFVNQQLKKHCHVKGIPLLMKETFPSLRARVKAGEYGPRNRSHEGEGRGLLSPRRKKFPNNPKYTPFLNEWKMLLCIS